MLSEEKIKGLIRLSEYEEGQGETDLQRTGFGRRSYIIYQAAKTSLCVFISELLIILLIGLYSFDDAVLEVYYSNIRSLLAIAGLAYIIICPVFVFFSCRISARHYDESSTRVHEYETTLTEVLELYDNPDEEVSLS